MSERNPCGAAFTSAQLRRLVRSDQCSSKAAPPPLCFVVSGTVELAAIVLGEFLLANTHIHKKPTQSAVREPGPWAGPAGDR